MGADANERTIRLAYQALNTGDLKAGLALIDPDCEIRSPFTSLSGKTYSGHTGVEAWAAEVSESWDDVEQTPQRLIHVDPERTVVVVGFRGRGKESHVEIEETLVTLWTVRNGKVTGVEAFDSVDEALRASHRSD